MESDSEGSYSVFSCEIRYAKKCLAGEKKRIARCERMIKSASDTMEYYKKEAEEAKELLIKAGESISDIETEGDDSEEDEEYSRKRKKILREAYEEANKKVRASLDDLKSNGVRVSHSDDDGDSVGFNEAKSEDDDDGKVSGDECEPTSYADCNTDLLRMKTLREARMRMLNKKLRASLDKLKSNK